MDFCYLVESGKYSEETLTEKQSEFLAGMRFAREEIRNAADNLFDPEDGGLMYKMQAEIEQGAAVAIDRWLYATECEYIVSCGDENGCEEEVSLTEQT